MLYRAPETTRCSTAQPLVREGRYATRRHPSPYAPTRQREPPVGRLSRADTQTVAENYCSGSRQKGGDIKRPEAPSVLEDVLPCGPSLRPDSSTHINVSPWVQHPQCFHLIEHPIEGSCSWGPVRSQLFASSPRTGRGEHSRLPSCAQRRAAHDIEVHLGR
jgi:hypothetical protein